VNETTPLYDTDFNVKLRLSHDEPYNPLQLSSVHLLMLLFELNQMRRMELHELPEEIDNRNLTDLKYNSKNAIKRITPSNKSGSIAHNAFQEFIKQIPQCPAIGGVLKYFISKAAHGGRVFANKGIYENVTLLDINSLYPKALSLLQIPINEPTIYAENANLNNCIYYVIDIDITFIKNKPMFYNYIKTGIRTVDKYELEDLIKYCGIDYTIIKGYTWTGETINVTDYINKLYEKKKNATGEERNIYKLQLNSIFGKTLEKGCKAEKLKRFTSDEAFYTNLHKCKNRLEQYNENERTVTLNKCYDTKFNHCYIGTAILSISKRIMNEIFYNCSRSGVDVLLHHTDSLMIHTKDLHKLQHLIGSELGELHIEIQSKEAIIIRGNCYYLDDSFYRWAGKSLKTIENKRNEYIKELN
jgi:hypothetical protein